jgi:hypothetical protein
LSNLFVRSDVTEATRGIEGRVPSWVEAELAMLAGPIPDAPVGPHCSAPYECPFMARCWPALPPDHVGTLYATRRRALELNEQGYRTIHDLPVDVSLHPQVTGLLAPSVDSESSWLADWLLNKSLQQAGSCGTAARLGPGFRGSLPASTTCRVSMCRRGSASGWQGTEIRAPALLMLAGDRLVGWPG